MKGIMIQGTSSDAGKSYVTTALCRIFSNMGYKVCPFKSQNMSNNSYVTAEGLEMGRAQGVQAEAARLRAETFMNPILLKPRKDTSSEIILMGQLYEHPGDYRYFKEFTKTVGIETVRKALKHIEENFDMIVIEGAGSPAEVNLNANEIVNMRIAREADVPVILVTDVNRGGSLASVVGTLELLGEDRSRVKGIIFNKFRGDIALFEDAVQWTEEYTGIKVVGVLPMLDDVIIEAEDALSFNWSEASDEKHCINIGVIHFPRVSNHTDIEVFRIEEDVKVSDIESASDLNKFDAILLPGTKSTIDDMLYLNNTGLADKLREFAKSGKFIYGLCGGYQIMGKKIYDKNFRDNNKFSEIDALGLLPIETYFCNIKTVRETSGTVCHSALSKSSVKGYEIHFGETKFTEKPVNFEPLFELSDKCDALQIRV